MYIYDALCDVAPMLHAFAKRGTKPLEYPSEPYPITKEEIERRRMKKEKAAYEKIKAKTNSFAIRFNAQFARGEVENNGRNGS